MENSIINSFPIDPGILLLILLALTSIMTIVSLVCVFQYRRLYRRYDIFMRAKDAETLEDVIMDLVEEADEIRSRNEDNEAALEEALDRVKTSYQKTGIVRYNAFQGMGGNLSFALAMLDASNSGFVLNSVHSREGCYLYLKEVDQGATNVILGNEEQQALEQALGYIGKPGRSRMKASREPKDSRETRKTGTPESSGDTEETEKDA
jgi:hypothetical protein